MKSKHSYETCLSVAQKFSCRIDFRNNANKEYQWLRRNGKLDIACAHMNALRRSLTDDEIHDIARKFNSRRAFKIGDQSSYNAATKRGILDKVCSHMSGYRYRVLSDEQIFEIARQFKSRVEFLEKDKAAYQTADKRGILNEACSHMAYRDTRRLTNDEILSIAKTFNTRNDFKLGDFGAYTTAIRRGLIEEACSHMEYGPCGFREDKPAVLYQFRIEVPGGEILYKVGITNRKPRQRLTTMGVKKGVNAELINFIKFKVGRDARIAEKRLALEFSAYRYKGERIMKNGNTELYTVRLLHDENEE